VGGELRAGGIDAADDLGGAVGEQLSGRGEPDPAADPLQQLPAGLGLQPGQACINTIYESARKLALDA
jgi:hypothetical protein